MALTASAIASTVGSTISGIASVGGGIGGFGALGMILHYGGVVGAAGVPTRLVSPSWFTSAARYHGGGIAGLKPDEMPAILRKGEEVLTAGDTRHRANGGLRTGDSVSMVLAIGEEEITKAFNNASGERVMLKMLTRNKEPVRQILVW